MKLTKIILLALLSVCTVNAFAVRVQVILTKIEAPDLQERQDEIYFSITQYPKNGNNKTSRVPMFPSHWISKNLKYLNNVNLWEQEINKDDEYEVIISLVEHDSPPWNVDDNLGSVKLKISKVNNKLESSWSAADYLDQPKVIQQKGGQPDFTFKSDNSKYHVAFKLKKS